MQLIEGPKDQDTAPEAVPVQASSDDTLIALWLAGKADRTRRAYQDDVAAFLRFVDKPLRQITLGDLVAWGETFSEMAPASGARKLGAVKSLAAFGHRLGYLAFDIGAPLRLPAVKTTLAERILGEGDVLRLLTLEANPRNHALLRLLYAGALRVSEICALTWRDLQPREDAGQVNVFGKGGKTRVVLLTPGIWGELTALRGDTGEGDPVFRSNKGGHLTPVQVHRIVKQAVRTGGSFGRCLGALAPPCPCQPCLGPRRPGVARAATLGHASVATTGRYLHARPNDSSARYLPD
jgi:integrase/recombinase XerD